MSAYETNGVPDIITLGPGVYLTRGGMAWHLAPEDSIVGAGTKRTTIRGTNVMGRYVIDGQVVSSGGGPCRVADLTVDANGINGCGPGQAAQGIALTKRRDVTVENVRVIGNGSFGRDVESFAIILELVTNGVVRNCKVEKNLSGYVSAFTISGSNVSITDCAANFAWKTGWDIRLQAFCLAGVGKGGSTDLRVQRNRTTGALFGVFCDTGSKINGLLIEGNTAILKDRPTFGAQAIRLTGRVTYLNVITNGNVFTVTK